MNAIPKEKPQPNIPVLCAAWLDAKKKEEQAREARIAIECCLIEALGFEKLEGSQTFKPDGFKVELKAGITYKLDAAKWADISPRIEDGYRPVKTKLEVDPAGIKFLKANRPEIWQLAAEAITSTPAKVGVTVSKVEG
jgi:hypothetical protein